MLRNHWYIACAATQLSSVPRTTQVLDQELMLFRDDAGHPHALLDRCCHRGAPLSLGEVVDGTLACRYHGGRYDGTGMCVHIPSLTSVRRIPKGYGVPAFPCVEADGYVWSGWAPRPASPPTDPVCPHLRSTRGCKGRGNGVARPSVRWRTMLIGALRRLPIRAFIHNPCLCRNTDSTSMPTRCGSSPKVLWCLPPHSRRRRAHSRAAMICDTL